MTTLSTPAQKASASTPVPGRASLVMKSYSTRATRRLPTSTRSLIATPLCCRGSGTGRTCEIGKH
ncbi:Uncharacterised protein [Mycobacteroides abscessus subsp. abscessus]|nr:Uncharacterised protein [Mycobacteroides abscessus subsp. abscessus]